MTQAATQPIYQGLRVRKLADKRGERVEITVRGEKRLFNPDTNKVEPWPTLGWMIENDPLPTHVKLPQQTVLKWRDAGFAKLEGERVVAAPGGTPDNPWQVRHVFTQAEVIVLQTTTGPVQYRVTQSPGAYQLDTSDPADMDAFRDGAKRAVLWYFLCELVEG